MVACDRAQSNANTVFVATSTSHRLYETTIKIGRISLMEILVSVVSCGLQWLRGTSPGALELPVRRWQPLSSPLPQGRGDDPFMKGADAGWEDRLICGLTAADLPAWPARG